MLVLGINTSFANGYKILGVKSVKANAMGEAFSAIADDPSAIAFNPAGVGQLKGNQITFQLTFCDGYTEHTLPDGIKTDNVSGWQSIPSLYFTSSLGEGRPVVGLGISVPNGVSSEWGNDSFARYVATYSDLFVADIAPTIAMQLSHRLMLGMSVNYYHSEARLDRMVDFGALQGSPGAIDIESSLEGEGDAWGATIGMIFDLTKKHRIAAIYRHPYSIDYEGELTLGGAPSDIEAEIDFPMTAVLAYAYKPMGKLTLSMDLDWTNWRDTGDIKIVPKTPGLAESVLLQDLQNTMAYKFGAEYLWHDSLALRFGYIFNENATPAASWRPSLPDADMHFFTAGFGYTQGGLTIDTALQMLIREDRTIDNNVDGNEFVSSSSIDGEYRSWSPCVSMSATYRF
jgi:long-chain fatty acid transport protein